MPPSGFNAKAISGLLQFVEGCYEDLLSKINNNPGLDIQSAIQEELAEIRAALKSLSLKDFK